MNHVHVTCGDSPLLLAQPHSGTEIPDAILQRLNADCAAKADTDWHIPQLYDALIDNVTVVSTSIHRYVVDANRNPSDESLYPGQNTTGLCPLTTFDGIDIYLPDQQPSADEIAARQQQYHQPYHDALREQMDRIHQKHGYAILYDCHSIRSVVPYLFEGQLPDFNIGTNSGNSCDPAIEAAATAVCENAAGYRSVTNGRFKGGWTTRHFGQPDKGFHAIQMELAQCNYMLENPPWDYRTDNAAGLRKILSRVLEKISTILE